MPAGLTISTAGFIPRKFMNMSLVFTMRLNNLVDAGVIVRSEKMDGFMTPGAILVDMPFWNDVQVGRTGIDAEGVAGVDRISQETKHIDFDPTITANKDPDPDGINSGTEVGVRLCRNHSWSVSDLTSSLVAGGVDAMTVMAGRTAFFKSMILQRLFFETMTGLFADNDAAPDTTEHVLGDLTLDVSNIAGAGVYSPGATDFSAATHIKALQLLGDAKGQISVIMMHSILESTIALKDLIETIRDSDGQVRYKTFMGYRLVINDEMTSPSAGVFDTYYFKPASLLLGQGSPKNPVEFERKPGAGQGGGQDVMYNRWEWCLHPVGHAWQLASSGGGPTYAQIRAGTSWKRVYPERKQIGIIRVRTRESA